MAPVRRGWHTSGVPRTSARLERRVRADVGAGAQPLVEALAAAPHPERVQAAATLWADGDVRRLRHALDLADVDRRDTLMLTHGTATDLADEGWQERLDAVLGPGRPVVLWRPTGPEELALVTESGWQAWPPRLPEQPFFYPVLTEGYATRIARDWNVPASGAGFVTRFEVEAEFMSRYAVHRAGGEAILEYWVPAVDLPELNANIVGRIEVVSSFGG